MKKFELQNPALYVGKDGKILTKSKAKKAKGVVTRVLGEHGETIEEIEGAVDLTEAEIDAIRTRYEVIKHGSPKLQHIMEEYPELAEFHNVEELDTSDDSEDFYSEDRVTYYATQQDLKPDNVQVHYYNPKDDTLYTVKKKIRKLDNAVVWTAVAGILDKIRNKGQYYWVVLDMLNPDGTHSYRSISKRKAL
jgi:hypothetical protein